MEAEMAILRRFWQTANAAAQRLPWLRDRPAHVRTSAAQGLVGGLVLLLVLSALLGAWNRGLLGLVVGALSGGLLGGALGLGVGWLVARARPPALSPRATIRITLDTANARYSPGEPLSGYVQLDAENTFHTAGLRVFVACQGSYGHHAAAGTGEDEPKLVRESQQYFLQEDALLPPSVVHRTSCATFPFHFTLPADALPTHHGHLCALSWTVHAALEFDKGEPLQAQQEFFVESMPPMLRPARGRYQREIAHADCHLTLTLPTVVCAEGETVEARVHISPLETLAIREVRAVLLRIENTPAGENETIYIDRWDPALGQFQGHRQPGGQGTTYVWLEDEAILTEPDVVELRHPVIDNVRLDIPAQWRPTMRTHDGQVVWKLGVIVTRDDDEDVRAFHEVVVHTGAAEITQMLDPERTHVRETIADVPAE
jgi:hypothetical protein